jgi:hypothetical protein
MTNAELEGLLDQAKDCQSRAAGTWLTYHQNVEKALGELIWYRSSDPQRDNGAHTHAAPKA